MKQWVLTGTALATALVASSALTGIGQAAPLDSTDPTITIVEPDGGSYARNQEVFASYTCADEDGGSGLASCTGTVLPGEALDTSTSGLKTFEVTAIDNAGNDATVTVTYNVSDAVNPSISVTSPASGAQYDQGSLVVADYECTDDPGGRGIQSCTGPVPDGAFIDTSTVGINQFKVEAVDSASNSTVVFIGYEVVAVPDTTPPRVVFTTPSPFSSAFGVGAAVTVQYDCTDSPVTGTIPAPPSSGIASCEGELRQGDEVIDADIASGDPLPTSEAGTFTLRVTATDNEGNVAVADQNYDVVEPVTTTIVAPADGTEIAQGAPLIADYVCEGRDVTSCVGDVLRAGQPVQRVAPGDAIDTSQPGEYELAVSAFQSVGNLFFGSISVAEFTVLELPAWDPDTVYRRGDEVSFEGSTYRATWWTRGLAPDRSPWLSWQEIAATADGTALWTPSRIFNPGDVVSFEGERYQAKWWTRNQMPGASAFGPWQPL